jgi:hypothetical protein
MYYMEGLPVTTGNNKGNRNPRISIKIQFYVACKRATYVMLLDFK